MYGVDRLPSSPTISFFFVLFLLFSYFSLNIPTIPTFLLSNAKLMIGLGGEKPRSHEITAFTLELLGA